LHTTGTCALTSSIITRTRTHRLKYVNVDALAQQHLADPKQRALVADSANLPVHTHLHYARAAAHTSPLSLAHTRVRLLCTMDHEPDGAHCHRLPPRRCRHTCPSFGSSRRSAPRQTAGSVQSATARRAMPRTHARLTSPSCSRPGFSCRRHQARRARRRVSTPRHRRPARPPAPRRWRAAGRAEARQQSIELEAGR